METSPLRSEQPLWTREDTGTSDLRKRHRGRHGRGGVFWNDNGDDVSAGRLGRENV